MSTTDEVLAAARHLVQAFGRHDTAAYFDCFAPDATFIFHTSAARLASRDEYQQLWRQSEHQDDFRLQSCTSAQQVVQDLGSPPTPYPTPLRREASAQCPQTA
jgi:ketosteroid isomerase-like protein